ncbi:hypothetical protein P376_5160 [Streptomyces sp. HCCB10043]|nr:hypothetical protein P376_5160 [Streptomyces sp. HCCB10043]
MTGSRHPGSSRTTPFRSRVRSVLMKRCSVREAKAVRWALRRRSRS